ncbi:MULTISPECIES: hypothetical protein [unclassified Streptomyces]|uniref:hypothetical protein n=1 Tax=unclassified Streptomyces TaxID=2593676 RepID=UPI0034501C38
MNAPQITRRPRAVLAIKGAQRARRRTRFVRAVARQLQEIAPGTVRVAVAPLVVESRPRTWVELVDADGRAVGTTREQHRAAFGLLSRAFPLADWTQPRAYDARTGVLAVDQLAAPADLGLDTVEGARP